MKSWTRLLAVAALLFSMGAMAQEPIDTDAPLGEGPVLDDPELNLDSPAAVTPPAAPTPEATPPASPPPLKKSIDKPPKKSKSAASGKKDKAKKKHDKKNKSKKDKKKTKKAKNNKNKY